MGSGELLLLCSNAHNFNMMKTPEHERSDDTVAAADNSVVRLK